MNAECPAPVLDTHSLNEPVFHNGVEYTLSDYAVLSEDEFCKQFNIDPLHVKAYGLHSKIIVFTMYAKTYQSKMSMSILLAKCYYSWEITLVLICVTSPCFNY